MEKYTIIYTETLVWGMGKPHERSTLVKYKHIETDNIGRFLDECEENVRMVFGGHLVSID